MKIDYQELRRDFNKRLKNVVPEQWLAPIVQSLIEDVKANEMIEDPVAKKFVRKDGRDFLG